MGGGVATTHRVHTLNRSRPLYLFPFLRHLFNPVNGLFGFRGFGTEDRGIFVAPEAFSLGIFPEELFGHLVEFFTGYGAFILVFGLEIVESDDAGGVWGELEHGDGFLDGREIVGGGAFGHGLEAGGLTGHGAAMTDHVALFLEKVFESRKVVFAA